jgi:hypothetical protein
MMDAHNIKSSSSLSSRRSKKGKTPPPRKKMKMMMMVPVYSDDQAPLMPNHHTSPQDGDSRIKKMQQQQCLPMWVGCICMCICMLSFVALVTGSIYKYEHSFHHPSEATIASVVPSLLIPAMSMPTSTPMMPLAVSVPTSQVKAAISIDLLAWQPIGDDYYYLYSVIPGLSWNTSLKPTAAASNAAIAAPAFSHSTNTGTTQPTISPWKKNVSQFFKNPTVLAEVTTIVACHFLWIGPLPSLLAKVATGRRLRVLSTLARRIRIFKPFQKVWKGIATIYKNRAKLSVASEYTFYVEASPTYKEQDDDNENDPKQTLESSKKKNNRTKKIATVHSRNATKQPIINKAKVPQF